MTDKRSNLESEVDKWKRAAAAKSIKVGTQVVEPAIAVNAISSIPTKKAASSIANVNLANQTAQASTTTNTNTPRSTIIKNQINGGLGGSSGTTGIVQL